MDQKTIGTFIHQLRKEKGITQLQLAEQLHITDRAVSKWERGKSLPDAGIMLELCAVLGISVNELLSGRRIEKENFVKEADQNLIKLHSKEAIANRKILTAELLILFMGVFVLCMGCFIYESGLCSGVYSFIFWGCILLFVLAIVIATRLEITTGYYKCKVCQKTFIPGLGAFLIGPHLGFHRTLKCPYCGEITLCHKVMSEE